MPTSSVVAMMSSPIGLGERVAEQVCNTDRVRYSHIINNYSSAPRSQSPHIEIFP